MSSIWDEVRGHREQIAMFRRAVQRNRTAHAYLFVGPPGVGKRLVARRIAQSLICLRRPPAELDACGECSACKQVQSGVHPDLLTVGLPEGRKELPIELLLGSDERRGREGLLRELSLRPMSAGRRIAIIDDADCMSEPSANALLKTLEEPPPDSILILISPSSDALLPTIRSRCQPLHFSPLTTEDVSELLMTLELAPDRAAALDVARLSGGSLDTARQLLEPGRRALRDAVAAALAAHPLAPVESSRQLQKAIEELGGGTAGQREAAGWLLRFAVDFLAQALSPDGGSSPILDRFRRAHPPDDADAASRIADVLDRCFAAEGQLNQSMPVPLCLESLWHDAARILRGACVPS